MKRCAVLVIEDDASIRRGLVDALTFAGYAVQECGDGRSGLNRALETAPDLVLLDIMLPGALDGFQVLRELRGARPTLPVILVTARGGESDRVRGLSDGADDYVVKPFSAKELLARVEAVLRRSPQRCAGVRVLIAGMLEIMLERRELRDGRGEPLSLSEKEAAILSYLAMQRGRAVDRAELLQGVWGLNPHGLETRTVDMHVARLREKLASVGGSAAEEIICTVRGKGYMLAKHVKAIE